MVVTLLFLHPDVTFTPVGGCSAAASGGEGEHAEQEEQADPRDVGGEEYPQRGDPRPQRHARC